MGTLIDLFIAMYYSDKDFWELNRQFNERLKDEKDL